MPFLRSPKSSTLLKHLIVLTALFATATTGLIESAAAQVVFRKGDVRAPVCSNRKMREILAPARKKKSTVVVDCSPQLGPNSQITKRLILKGRRARGVTIDCNGGLINGGKNTFNDGRDMIVIHSTRKKNGGWRTPANIRIRNCEIRGSVRIYGMAKNGEGKALRASSRKKGHTKRARKAAPRYIWFDNVSIIGRSRIPLYIAPGTTHVSVTNSRIAGQSNSTAIYLDAESAKNIFRGNKIETKTKVRELVAIDGSSDNRFISNQFSALNHGGIYIYRNCGEGGTIRHATPSGNQIINNSFYYNKFNGFNFNIEKLGDLRLSYETPAIWVASRNGDKSYCNDDRGYRFGSSANNRDLAQNNVIAQNQIFKLSPEQMILVHERPNVTFNNITVRERIKRPAGCYIEDAGAGYFLQHRSQMEVARQNPRPRCQRQIFTCNNGLLKPVRGSCRR